MKRHDTFASLYKNDFLELVKRGSMKSINRPLYLGRLINVMNTHHIKIATDIRRSEKGCLSQDFVVSYPKRSNKLRGYKNNGYSSPAHGVVVYSRGRAEHGEYLQCI